MGLGGGFCFSHRPGSTQSQRDGQQQVSAPTLRCGSGMGSPKKGRPFSGVGYDAFEHQTD